MRGFVAAVRRVRMTAVSGHERDARGCMPPPAAIARRAVGVPAILATIAALVGVGWAGVALSEGAGGNSAIWLPNAVLLAVLLRHPGRANYLLQFAGFCAATTTSLLVGESMPGAVGLGIANSVETYIALHLIRRLRGARFDVSDLDDLGAFWVAAGLIAPAAIGLLVAAFSGVPGALFGVTWVKWALPHALGMVIATPAILIANDAWQKRVLPDHTRVIEWFLVQASCGVLAFLIFHQTSYPMLFLLAPAVLVHAFRLGMLGVLVVAAEIVVVLWVATINGSGPIRFVEGAMFGKLVVGQVVLAVELGLGMLVAGAMEGNARVHAQLREHRELHQSMLENMREVIFRADGRGRWEFLNPAWEMLTGYTTDESLGTTMTALLDPRDRASAAGLAAGMMAGDADAGLVLLRMIARDGVPRQVEVSIHALRAPDGALIGTIGNIRDVTEQQATVAALAENRRRFQTLANLSPAGIFRTDVKGRCTYVNPAWTRLSGLELADAIDLGWYRALHADDRETVLTERAEAYHRGATYRGQYRLVRPDGATSWVECASAPDIDDNGLITGYIGVVIDITELKSLEFALEAACERSMEAVRAKSSFLANMSHEIRTPMNAVVGFTELLLRSDLNDEQKRHARLIAESGTAMMRLLNDILDLSKIEAGHVRVHPEVVDPGHLLKSCIKLMNPMAIQKKLALRCAIDDDVPEHVMVDGLRLRQIILNLLGNALKFTDRGSVTLRACCDPERPGVIAITVEDTGPGISPDRQPAIFDEFVQADINTARRYGGSGLGLAISNKLAHMMGGDITLDSVLGSGARFTVRIMAPAVSARATTAISAAQPMAARGTERVGRILLVEDHDINQALMVDMLHQIGLTAEIAENGQEAIDLVQAAHVAGKPYALVLMDMQMPVMGGVEAARAIRRAGLAPHELPIVALTANAYAEDIAACLEAGMQAHLSKPIGIDALDAALRQWCRAEEVPTMAIAQAPPVQGRSLQDRYRGRKADVLAALDALLRDGRFTDSELGEVAAMLHKLAGTAAYFGDAALGERAGDMERGLEIWPVEERAANIAEAVAAIRRAA
ncbi:PAS domain S-box protein [Sphingomonas sp. RT2P30]|uniref:PAS domain S-box protein n=1 Tax=Parasphingomonas halimpatiens TaxID=3096162 RepID=UPI002FCC3BA8